MAQLQKKFLANNAVDENKIRLSNNAAMRARNAANSGDVNILKVNASDRIEFSSIPQVTADASAPNDIVRYSQVTALLDGFKPKAAVRLATAAAGVLATDFENGDTVDGVVLVTGDRILIKDQAAPEENGIYTVNATGAPTRATDYDSVTEIPGSYTVAQFGTANQGTLFVTTSTPATIDVDPIVFVARAIQSYTGGDMITLSTGVFSVDLAAVSGLESTNAGNAAGQLRIKLEASNPSLQIDGSNQLGVKIDTARGLSSGASGLGVDVAAAGALQFSGGDLAVKVDAATVKINGSNNLESLKGREQKITLSPGDITNQYVDLAFAAFGASAADNSVQLSVVGGPVQEKVVDYTVSLTGGAGGVTRLTFAGALATGGASELIAGDILLVNFSYLT